MGRIVRLTALVATVGLAAMPVALACSFDTDCQPGSVCQKASTSIYGFCAGGLQPGNSYDRQPAYDSLDVNRTAGNTCSFDTDCGPGSVCAKGSGIYGVCRR